MEGYLWLNKWRYTWPIKSEREVGVLEGSGPPGVHSILIVVLIKATDNGIHTKLEVYHSELIGVTCLRGRAIPR
jgi:hypothetical protein